MAKHLIGVLAPRLVSAIQEVKENRPRHNRHPHIAHGKSTPHVAKPIGNPRRGIKAKGRTTRQHQRIHLLDHTVRAKQIGLTRARRTAHHMYACGKGRIAHQHRHA